MLMCKCEVKMPVVPEEALQKLKCFSCKKYLSVFPVKVYPNRNVICGRCEQVGGTNSRLYELVAKQVEFPCINRFEGCKEVLLASHVKTHETTCYSDEYVCPLCSNFSGSSYDLLYHVKIRHKMAALEDTNFLIDLEQGSTSELYFYCRNELFVFVSYQYDAMSHQLSLNLNIMGKQHKNQQNLTYKFLLYSIRKKLQYKTGDLSCLESGLEDGKGTIISLLNHKYPKNIVFCQFQVWDPVLVVEKYRYYKKCVEVQCNLPQIIDGSVNEALLTFKFVDISNLKEDTPIYSNCKYFVGDINWYLRIERIKWYYHETASLLVSLHRDELDKKCEIKATITLVSLTPILNKSDTFIKNNIRSAFALLSFITWNDLLDPLNRYVENDTITFQVLLDVQPYKAVMCNKCKTVCSKCDQDSD